MFTDRLRPTKRLGVSSAPQHSVNETPNRPDHPIWAISLRSESALERHLCVRCCSAMNGALALRVYRRYAIPMRSIEQRIAGSLLQSARERLGLSQTAFADLLGIAQPTLSAYESGHRQPTLPTLLRMLERAGLVAEWSARRHEDVDCQAAPREATGLIDCCRKLVLREIASGNRAQPSRVRDGGHERWCPRAGSIGARMIGCSMPTRSQNRADMAVRVMRRLPEPRSSFTLPRVSGAPIGFVRRILRNV